MIDNRIVLVRTKTAMRTSSYPTKMPLITLRVVVVFVVVVLAAVVAQSRSGDTVAWMVLTLSSAVTTPWALGLG